MSFVGTGRIAKVFHVTPRTVAKWIDTGLLQGTRIPGSKHRRVTSQEVERFATEHQMPFTQEELHKPRKRKTAI